MSNLNVHKTLSGATTPRQSETRSNVNEGVLQIPQFSDTGASPSNGFVSYPEQSLGSGSYLSAKMQSVNSTAHADWAEIRRYQYLINGKQYKHTHR